MQAAVFDTFGEPADVLAVREIEDRDVRPGHVRVRMLASPINPSDLMTVRGVYSRLPELPATPGYEGVGVVESAGSGLLPKLLVGRRVVVLNRGGGNWANFAMLPASQVVPVSEKLPIDQAATFFVNPVTAYVMTRRVLRVSTGEWLLQTAAGSMLGRMIIRLGQIYGFGTINVVRRQEQADELRKLGATEVLVTDGNDLPEKVRAIAGDDGVSFAVDPVGGFLGSQVARCLGPTGRMLVYGTLSGEPLSVNARDLMTPGSRVEGFWLPNYMNTLGLLGKIRLLRQTGRLIRRGILTTPIGKVYPLTEVADAVRHAEEVGRGGKILLRMVDQLGSANPEDVG